MKKSVLILGIAISSVAVFGCGSDSSPVTTQPDETQAPSTEPAMGGTQTANPASEYCISQGGTLEIVDESTGQVGYCNLADGTRVEEWEYFNAG